jgi:hypothetical protein
MASKMMICLAACFALLCLVQLLNAEPLVQGLNAEPFVQKHEIQKRGTCNDDVCINAIAAVEALLSLALGPLVCIVNSIIVSAVLILISPLLGLLAPFLLAAGCVLPSVSYDVFCGQNCQLSLLLAYIRLFLDLGLSACGLPGYGAIIIQLQIFISTCGPLILIGK